MITQSEINRIRMDCWTKEDFVLALERAENDNEQLMQKIMALEKFASHHAKEIVSAIRNAKDDPDFKYPDC